MELAHQMKLRRMVLRARWLPRDENQEADDLTNDEFRHFDLKKRIKAELKDLKFTIMDSLFAVGDTYLAELEAARDSEKRKRAVKQARDGQRKELRKTKTKGLRETDPWS